MSEVPLRMQAQIEQLNQSHGHARVASWPLTLGKAKFY